MFTFNRDKMKSLYINKVNANNLFPLTKKEQFVLEKRFSQFSLEQIGNMMGCTRERIRQHEMKAFTKLQFNFKKAIEKCGKVNYISENIVEINGYPFLVSSDIDHTNPDAILLYMKCKKRKIPDTEFERITSTFLSEIKKNYQLRDLFVKNKFIIKFKTAKS